MILLQVLWLASNKLSMKFGQITSNFSICYRQVLARALKYCQVTLDCLSEAGVAVTLQRRVEHEAAHYCSVCEVYYQSFTRAFTFGLSAILSAI